MCLQACQSDQCFGKCSSEILLRRWAVRAKCTTASVQLQVCKGGGWLGQGLLLQVGV